MTERDHVVRALAAKLSKTLAPGALVDCREGDPDERTASHVSGADVGRPMAWVRPRDTDEVAAVIRTARELGVRVVPIGRATTFWGGTDVRDAIALDTTPLTSPFVLDEEARIAHVGAGCAVRTVDRAARRLGLCVAARPDAGGDTPVGSMLAVASTAGLGMGLTLPVDQFIGATAVTGTGSVVRIGASGPLHGLPHVEHGLPHALSLLAGAEGRGCVVTEVGLRLRRAPHVVTLRASRSEASAPTVESVVDLLGTARNELDRGGLDSFRIELGAHRGAAGGRLELFVRAYSDESSEAALAIAGRWRHPLSSLGFQLESFEPEPTTARDGTDDAYHWSFGQAEHRSRLLGAAFWGAEVSTPWGASTRSALRTALGLYQALASVDPVHRRFAVYPGHALVSVGVHVLVPKTPESVQRTADLLRSATPALVDVGVPYRGRGLFAEALAAKGGSDGARATSTATDAMFAVLDPDGLLGSARRTTDPR